MKKCLVQQEATERGMAEKTNRIGAATETLESGVKEPDAYTEVKFYEEAEDHKLLFAVIISRYNGKWVFCKHKERDTYEVPGGHREPGETIFHTAERELQEETGAIDFNIVPLCAYSVRGNTRVNEKYDQETFGMLYFAEIYTFDKELHSEIEKIMITEDLPKEWTYPLIQPRLLEFARKSGYL